MYVCSYLFVMPVGKTLETIPIYPVRQWRGKIQGEKRETVTFFFKVGAGIYVIFFKMYKSIWRF